MELIRASIRQPRPPGCGAGCAEIHAGMGFHTKTGPELRGNIFEPEFQNGMAAENAEKRRKAEGGVKNTTAIVLAGRSVILCVLCVLCGQLRFSG